MPPPARWPRRARHRPALADDPANRPVALDGTNNTYVDTSLVGGINQAGSIVGWFNLATLPSTAGHVFTVAGESQVGNDFDFQIETDNELKFSRMVEGRSWTRLLSPRVI